MKIKTFIKTTILVVAIPLTLTSCAYRADLAQGNFVEQEKINMLQYGMTYDQVKFILGTPMLVDPFDNSRWYYVHFLRQGWSEPEIKNLVVRFQGGRLVEIKGDWDIPQISNSINNTNTDTENSVSPFGAM